MLTTMHNISNGKDAINYGEVGIQLLGLIWLFLIPDIL